MKKFLSLVLALIMTMSLVTVSAGAKDFTDDDKLNYEEAVAVMSEIGVIDGYTDGTFKPQNGLTRGAAAKIICNMILGPTTASALRADTAPFKDVPVDNQYAGYIAYCVQQGITSGYTDGTYRPAAPLTNFAFMKMLLGALGYDATTEGYVGGNCFINVAKQAIGIGLNAGLMEEFDGGKQINREEAALFAFNTLKATMVEYDQKTVVTVGNAEVSLSGNLKDVEWTGTKNADGNIKDDGKVQFAEKYFSKLVGKDDVDVFGRPATTWAYNKEGIGTYVDWSLMVAEYTASVKGGTAYDAIGKTAVEDYKLFAYTDGETSKELVNAISADIYKKSTDTVENTGKGALTQIFVDIEEEEVTVTTINTWLAEATSDYSEKSESVTLKVYDRVDVENGKDPSTHSTTKKAELDVVPNIVDIEDEDIVMVTIAAGEIQTVAEPEVVSEVAISSYKTGYEAGVKNDETNPEDGWEYKLSNVTADGEKYEVAKKGYWDAKYMYNYAVTDLKDNTYNLYLDPYGYIIGVECIDEKTDYVFVVGYDVGSSVLAKATDKALVILPDGTMKTVDIDDSKLAKAPVNKNYTDGYRFTDDVKSVNLWYKYTTDADGMIVLKELVNTVHDTETIEINGSSTTVEDTDDILYGNSKSVYISVKADTDVDDNGTIVDVKNVTTGIKKTSIKLPTKKNDQQQVVLDDTLNGAYGTYACADGGYVRYAVVVGSAAGVSEDLVYLVDGITRKYYDADLGDYYYTYDVIKNGEIVEIKSLVNKDTDNAYLSAHYLYQAAFDGDGYATEMELKAEIASADRHTSTYRDTSYLRVDFADNAPSTLTLKGATLYLTAQTNNQYVVLDDECNFFVYASDDDEYVEYADAEDALDALGTTTAMTGRVVAVCNAAGYATTLVIYDTYTANDEAVPSQPGVAGTKITGTKTSAATSATELKIEADGAYSFAAGSTFTGLTDLAGEIEENVFFKFETTESSQGVILRIFDEDGNRLYNEFQTIGTAGGHFFYVQVLGTISGNQGTGDLKTNPLSVGDYTWTITSGNTTLANGTFSIAK